MDWVGKSPENLKEAQEGTDSNSRVRVNDLA